MSVINRMLRDLDQRKQQPGGTHQPAAIAPRASWSKAQLLIVVGVVLVGVAIGSWLLNSNEQPAEPKPLTLTRDAGSNTTPEAATSEATTAEAASPEAASPEISATPATASDSAAERTRASESEPTAKVAADPQQAPDSDAIGTNDVAITTATPATVAKETPTNKAALVAANESQRTTEAATETKPEPASSLSIKRVQLSPSALAQRNLEKAEEAFNKGNQREGQRLLEEALAVQPMNIEVRERLSAYWYGRGFGNRAIVLLNEGIQLAPQADKLKLLLARIYQRLDMNNEAYQVLNGLTLTGSDDVVPLAQRAELAWQNQDFERAIADYQRLTQVQPSHARWWLGLALAYDDHNQVIAATSAYQQALQVGGLNVASQQYIEARLAQLLPLVEVN